MTSPDSPSFTYGDRVKVTDVYMGPQSLCATSMLARGTFGTGSRAGYVVSQCTVVTMRGTIGKLTIEWEAGGAAASQPLPVGDFSLQPQELYPKIERASPFQTPVAILPDMIRATYNALYTATDQSGKSTEAATIILLAAGLTSSGSPPTWSTPTPAQAAQIALANNLLTKLSRGEETFYLAGQRYSYWFYSYTVPVLSNGGVIVTPDGPLAGQLPPNLAWLRLADSMEPAGVNGSMYKITRSYIGGPTLGGIGYWDADVYTGV